MAVRFHDARHAQLIRGLTAAAADDRGDAQRLYQLSTGPRQAAIVARLQQGVDAGEVRPDADLASVADALLGVLLVQLLTGNEDALLSRAEGVLAILLAGLRP